MKHLIALAVLIICIGLLAGFQGTVPAVLPLTVANGGTGGTTSTGSGAVVLAASPTLTTPIIGVATATSINKMAITAPATSSTLAVADGKTATVSNTLTLAGTDSTTQTFPGVTANVVGLVSAANSTTDTLSCNTVSGGTAQSFATTYTIPANYLVNNKTLKAFAGISLTTSGSPPTMQLILKVGTTTVYTATGGVPTASLTGIPFGQEWYIMGTAAAGASVAVHTHPAAASTSSNGIFVPGLGKDTVTQPQNLATNGTLAVNAGLICSANTASNSLTLNQFVVEALN